MTPLASASSGAPFRRRMLWLMGGRVTLVTVLLVSAILMQVRSPGTFPIDPFFFLIGCTYALTAVYLLLLRQAEQHPWIVEVQLACDAVIVSALVYLTGGVASAFSTLYTLPIIAASTLQLMHGGLLLGVLSSVLYGGIVFAQFQGIGVVPPPVGIDTLPPARVALYTVGSNTFGFLAVAALSGYLAEGLRRTGRKLEEASNQLADLQAFSEYAINSLMSGFATTDFSGRLLTFNRAAETITGVAAPEAIGRTVQEVLQLPEAARGMFGSEAGRAGLPRVEYDYQRADGRGIELGISTAILMTPRGATGFVFTFQDVTESRKQERQARIQQRLAAVGEMAAGIAHEIRNPLASMSGSIQILRQELPLTEEQAQLMDIVLRESERLNDTIRSFLAYARPQRHPAAPLDVCQVVTDTATLLQNSPERDDAHVIEVDVPADPVWCVADEGQIRQILWNLATNGLRAMPAGGDLTLAVSATAPDARRPGDVTLTVSDDGVGMAADELEELLQPFRGRFARGTGLGLSIVHRIVSDWGGELRVASEPGRGTTVTVTLPNASRPAALAAAVS